MGRRPIRNRGILTQEETLKLLSHKWSDRRAYLAFCIAVNCGLRVGEIRALKIGHINREGFLLITNSFNDVDGLKCTKTGKNRVVPCPDSLMSLIVDYIYSLPEEERADDRFLLTDDGGERPLGKGFCIKKFYTAMRECGIKRERANPLTGEMEYICFHSLRHQTATRWVESGLDVRLIAKAMGHTVDMLSHYSDHFNLHDMDSLRAGLVSHNSLGACTA